MGSEELKAVFYGGKVRIRDDSEKGTGFEACHKKNSDLLVTEWGE